MKTRLFTLLTISITGLLRLFPPAAGSAVATQNLAIMDISAISSDTQENDDCLYPSVSVDRSKGAIDFYSANIVSADATHPTSFLTHEQETGPECGPAPTNGCIVTVDTTFTPAIYSLPEGIRVSGDGVTLDCSGATLRGSNADYSIGINLEANDLTIRKCNIERYMTGIRVAGSDNSTIEFNSIILEHFAGPLASEPRAIQNFGFSTAGLVIRHNQIQNVFEEAIHLEGDDNVIDDNTVTGHLHLVGSRNIVKDNTILPPVQQTTFPFHIAVLLVNGTGGLFEGNIVDGRSGLPTSTFVFIADSAVDSVWVGNAFRAVEVQDDGTGTIWCVGSRGNTYLNGATYTGPSLGTCVPNTPIILVHGWHGPDEVGDSQFKYMWDWLDDDGFDVYYATGINATQTLQEGAPVLRDFINDVKAHTGAEKVIIIGHSRGGLNTRAYVESSLYEGDVAQVIMLGTPNAGATLLHIQEYLYAELAKELLGLRSEDDIMSVLELDPWYMVIFNLIYRNDHSIPYYLIGGDGGPVNVPLVFPPNDFAVTVASVHAAMGSQNVYMRTHDVHGWNRWSQLLGKGSYLLPRDTYDACIRPAVARTGPGEECNATYGSALTARESTGKDTAHTRYQSGVITAGETLTHSIHITATGSSQFNLVWDQGDLDLALLDPVGTTIDPENADMSPNVDFIAFEPDTILNYNTYVITDTIAGTWTLAVTANYTEPMDVAFSTFASLEPTLDLEVSTHKTLYDLNEPVVVTATLSYESTGLPSANVAALVGKADLLTETLTLYDDGTHEDRLVDDGVYGNTYSNTDVGGPYSLFVTAEGLLHSVPYARADEVTIQVSPETAQLTGNYSDYPEDGDSNGRYEYLVTEVEVDATSAGAFLVSGILFGPGDEEIASVVHPVSLATGTHTVPLKFDGDLIYLSGLDGPYMLTQVFLMDSSGLPIKLDEAYDAWGTDAYDHTKFGLNEVVQLPLVMKNY